MTVFFFLEAATTSSNSAAVMLVVVVVVAAVEGRAFRGVDFGEEEIELRRLVDRFR